MENILMTFFWICVISANVLANSLPLSDSKIPLMRKHVKCPSNSTFYAPTNIKVILCMTTALDCCLKELDGKIRKECDDPHEYVDDAVEYLNVTIDEWKDSHPLTNSSQCACKRWPKTHLSHFLDKMESLLQLLNNEASF
uniref:Interleukin n=1 Tax=Hippocampus comes TaxID=109280 RepID=A0A3Q2YMT1_HIPCM